MGNYVSPNPRYRGVTEVSCKGDKKKNIPNSHIIPLQKFIENVAKRKFTSYESTVYQYSNITQSIFSRYLTLEYFAGIPYLMHVSIVEEGGKMHVDLQRVKESTEFNMYSFITVTCSKIETQIAHSVIVFLDHVDLTFEVFDPNVSESSTENEFVDCEMETTRFINVILPEYKKIETLDFCPVTSAHYSQEGYCTMVCIMYVMLRAYFYNIAGPGCVSAYLSLKIRGYKQDEFISKFISYIYAKTHENFEMYHFIANANMGNIEVQNTLIKYVQGVQHTNVMELYKSSEFVLYNSMMIYTQYNKSNIELAEKLKKSSEEKENLEMELDAVREEALSRSRRLKKTRSELERYKTELNECRNTKV